MMQRRLFLQGMSQGLLLLGVGREVAHARGGELVAIVGARTSPKNLSVGTLKRIFLAQHVEHPDGERFVPFNQPPNTSARVHFDRRILGMDPDEVARYWVDQRIRGATGAPRAVASSRLLIRVVAKMPGAIAYVSASDLEPSVRALNINRHPPQHEDYPLK